MSVILTPVILCGGSGTRLWPLSRQAFPKQFVPLIDQQNLLQMTLARLTPFANTVLLLTAEQHRFMAVDALASSNYANATLILEPYTRNTAVAMGLACLYASPDDVLLFCPADHYLPDASAFQQAVESAIPAAHNDAIVTFGIQPTFASDAYGYITVGEARTDAGYHIHQFVEKPNTAQAVELIATHKVLWNGGIFLCKAQVLLNALQQHALDIWQACQTAMQTIQCETTHQGYIFVRPAKHALADCRAESIDYAVLEHHTNLAVMPLNTPWSDVGSWNALAELYPSDAQHNRIHGQGIIHEAHHTFIHAPTRPVVALGTHNLTIVDTPDALLVADNSTLKSLKTVVQTLSQRYPEQTLTHKRVMRPWGWYDTIDQGEQFLVKRIAVNVGASLSLQKHQHRAEHWVVVKGEAEVTCNQKVFRLIANQSTYIPIGTIHRLRNVGDQPLEIIEIQTGAYLSEEDITRFDDDYGRNMEADDLP